MVQNAERGFMILDIKMNCQNKLSKILRVSSKMWAF